MNKFNLPLRNIQKERRAKRSEKRRLRSGVPSLKISVKPGSRSLSGKKKQKLEKKWRKTQKEALEGGLVTMEDIQMLAADEEGSIATNKLKVVFTRFQHEKACQVEI